ncbi:uncharacterized protein LOC126778732 [Nymphalis io]|uniref:uncharacterized protein LOC126778732 n=1 Tax=Inachis io TaxID=171585 RepID=UPI002168AA93|nr:uncharacterized protein LOC126778732 [Nymphalis io]
MEPIAPQAPKPKLATPRTAAVVTLQPEAQVKGVTYAHVLERAEQGVKLQDLGICGGLKVRRSATGARVLELPRAQSDQAEKLAEKLRTVLDGVANVVRHTMKVDLRVTGLDDSVTREKLIAAVAREGSCPVEAIKCGEMSRGPGYMGMARVTCPIAVAKKLSDSGCLLVGWSSARVHVLEQRPLRCFKCMGLGHTKALCPSRAERAGLCFRCGVDGLKSVGCTGKLRCAVCADAGKPSGHMMGSRECIPPITKEISFLQTNLNHCAGAQDLLLQSMAEWEIDLAVACEPYYVLPLPHWAGDLDDTVAVLTRNGTGPPLSLIERGSGYVVAEWGEYVVVGTYFSPNRSLVEFETYLGSLRAAVARQSMKPILVLGDLNAKSRAWGNPATNLRGRAVQVWALLSGLSLLNKGQAHTCVRHNGGSVVDVSFATPVVARRVSEWRVEEEVETLSDHRYIQFEISTTRRLAELQRVPTTLPRWSLGQLDRELVKEAAIVQRWGSAGRREGASVEELAGRISRALKEVCDAAMPRTRRRAQRRHVYWWSPEIAELRATCNRARRAYVRCRRRNGLDVDLEGQLLAAYRQLKKDLQLAISRAKEKAREELLVSLNRNPWGRAYRGFRRKFRTQTTPVTETLPPELVLRLFNIRDEHRGSPIPRGADLSEETVGGVPPGQGGRMGRRRRKVGPASANIIPVAKEREAIVL